MLCVQTDGRVIKALSAIVPEATCSPDWGWCRRLHTSVAGRHHVPSAHHGAHGLLWCCKLNEGHASGPAISVHDEAHAARLDLVAVEELAHVSAIGLEWDALHLQDALAAKAQSQGGLHLLAGHLGQQNGEGGLSISAPCLKATPDILGVQH